ncbi:MAG: DUF3089 domain-containing protein [Paludibacteraceae bacterium]|nr:DUF3089 domain-containing protein [Paludibacteraceae bacterium]
MNLIFVLLIDVFYIISTNVVSDSTFNASLTQEQQQTLQQESRYVTRVLGDSFEVYAPLYHQFTLDAILAEPKQFDSAYTVAKEDILRQFDEYIATLPDDRPFFLMGFSQGAMLAREVLKAMPRKVYQRCLGVYMMGYKLGSKEVINPRFRPARSATKGMVVSYNSVTDPNKAWPFISKGAVTCINPVNWTTDATPAMLVYKKDTMTVTVDKKTHLLVVTAEEDKYYNPAFAPWYKQGALHTQDLLFYLPYLRENMRARRALLKNEE